MSTASRYFGGFVLVTFLVVQSSAQDQPASRFYRKLETPKQFWEAMNFEIELGKYRLAYTYLEGFLKKLPEGEEGDKELIQMEEKLGMSAFLRLVTVPDVYRITNESLARLRQDEVPEAVLKKLNDTMVGVSFTSKARFMSELAKVLSKEELEAHREKIAAHSVTSMRKLAEPLIERVSQAVKRYRSDPERIRKFIRNLSKTEEERAYAISELRRSGAIVVPYFIEELLRTTGDEENRIERHANLLTALVRLHRDVVPPLLASLDTHDKFLQAELIDVLRMRGDERAVDYLWYLSASPKSPDFVRKRATETLEMFLNTRHLPDAREELTKIAERYYLKKVEFPDREKITFWRWEGKRLVTPPETLSASQVEELLGLRFARQALDLDPTYEPAQRIFLSLALDKAYERVGIDQPLEKLDANVRNLLRSVNPQLLMDVLERAMSEHRLTVVLGVVRTLGDLAETRAAMPKFRESSPLIRALSYPDRRVQLSAADALLRIPGERPAIAAARIVQVLRRAAAAPGVPKVLIGDFDHDRAIAVAGVVKKAGFEPVIAGTGREVMQRLAQAADIDALLIDESIPNPVLRHLLAQIRADMDNGLLPLFIMARRTPDGGISPKSELTLSRLASYYRYVWVIPSPRSADALKEHLQKAMAQTFGKPLAEQERLDNATLAMVWLRRMGTEEVAGFDIRSAEATILASFRSEMLGTLAMEAALGLPGRDPQRELAGIVLDKTLKPEKRTFAASQLNRHIQKYGILLTLEQIRALRALYDQVDEPRLKANVALVLGSLRPNTKRTGNRLLDYYPSLPAKKDAGPNPMPQPKKP